MKKAKDLFINKVLKKKRILIPLIIVLAIGIFFLFRSNNNAKNTVTDFVKYSDLKQTVLSTGQVVSNTDLNLSFNSSGVVKSIKVKVGDNVKEGQILANLDQASELATLTSARGALAAANARYKRTLEGATNEEITISQLALSNAKRDYENVKMAQETLVKNAYSNLLNSSPEAVPEDGTSDYTAPTISGTYNLGKEGKMLLSSYYSSGGTSFNLTGLTNGTGVINTIIPQPLGDSGLYIKFPSNTYISITDWVIEIPNKKAANYLTNYNAYQSALKTQSSALSSSQSLVDQRTAELALKQSSARASEIDLAKADIISAQGQVEQATAKYNNTIITAPLDGTITSIDIKQGELASALKQVIILQDISNIYIEANINEANISGINLGMPIDITYDAFGSEKIFQGSITKINPSSTLVSGVVNYKITASVEQASDLRPGMTANMTIKVKEKNHVLAIPSRAIILDKTNAKIIRIVKDTRTKAFKEVLITTGLEGDGSMVEVINGLKENDEFVVLIKTK
jgi:RND family efflux transporter MFP subunit